MRGGPGASTSPVTLKLSLWLVLMSRMGKLMHLYLQFATSRYRMVSGALPVPSSMRWIPLTGRFAPNFHSIGRMQLVIFHLAVLLLIIFLICTDAIMREEEEDAEAWKAEQCHLLSSKSVTWTAGESDVNIHFALSEFTKLCSRFSETEPCCNGWSIVWSAWGILLKCCSRGCGPKYRYHAEGSSGP